MTFEPQVIHMEVSYGESINMTVGYHEAVNMGFGSCVNMGTLKEHYTGDYVVIPKADQEQILETANKLMDDNVTVKKVPYYETSNPTGNTVYIASEVN